MPVRIGGDPEWVAQYAEAFVRFSDELRLLLDVHVVSHVRTHAPAALDAVATAHDRMFEGVQWTLQKLPNQGMGLNAHVITTAVVAGVLLAVLSHVCMFLCDCCGALCCRRRGGRDRQSSSRKGGERFGSPSDTRGKLFVCTLCGVDVHAGAAENESAEALEARLAKHKAGKRHVAALKAHTSSTGSSPSESDVFQWLHTEQLDKLRRRLLPDAHKQVETHTAPESKASEEAAREGKPKGVALMGNNVAVVHGQSTHTHAHAHGDEGWTKVGDGKAKAKSATPGVVGSNLHVLRDLICMEGGRNMLEGLSVAARFVTGSQETAIVAHIDASIPAGQTGRLRGSTFEPSRGGVAAQLHYGVHFAGNGISPAKPVEPLPPVLRDIGTRILARSDVLGRPPANRIDAATVFVLEPGMHLPPLVVPGGAVQRPFYLLVLAGDEDVLLGSRIEPLPTPGQFDASFAYRAGRRTLLCFDGSVGAGVNIAVAETGSRVILVLFLAVAPQLRAELAARGNVLA